MRESAQRQVLGADGQEAVASGSKARCQCPLARSTGDIVLARWPWPRRGTGAELSWGAGPSQEPAARGSRVPEGFTPLLRSAKASWGATDFIYFLHITSLLNILKLPRFSETRQPKGISLLTWSHENAVRLGELLREEWAGAPRPCI